MKKSILAALALATLASCTKESESTAPDVISITSGITTRASGTEWESGDAIGIFATEHNTTTVVGTSNSQYTASTSGESSIFNPVDYLYYPPTANIDILAYYPYSDATTTTATNYDVDVYTNQENHPLIDLMTAKAKNKARSSQAIELAFDHKLSQIEVTLVAKENGGFVDSDLATAKVTIGGTIVNASYNLSTDAITFDDEATATDLTLTAASNVATFIIIPQKATPEFTITVNEVDYETTATEFEMTSGNTYAYVISVSKTTIQVTGSNINDWSSDGTSSDLEADDYNE